MSQQYGDTYPTMFAVGQAPPAMPAMAPAMTPGAVPPPPMQNPQVFAQNYQCPVPNIQTFAQPPCNDPARSVQVTKRVFDTEVSGLFIIDTGTTMDAEFGATQSGALAGAPAAGSFSVVTDSTTTGVVRDITVAFDPFSDISAGPDTSEALRSFGWSFSAMLAGTITIFNSPFPTVIPIASAIKNVGGIDAYWTQRSLINQFVVSPRMEATHAHAPAPIEIFLPTASDYPVEIDVPTRNINAGLYAGPAGAYVYVWTGVCTILIEKNTRLGSLQTT